MTPSQLKLLMEEYARTLNSSDQDDWYVSTQGLWNEAYPGFLKWLDDKNKERRAERQKRVRRLVGANKRTKKVPSDDSDETPKRKKK